MIIIQQKIDSTYLENNSYRYFNFFKLQMKDRKSQIFHLDSPMFFRPIDFNRKQVYKK